MLIKLNKSKNEMCWKCYGELSKERNSLGTFPFYHHWRWTIVPWWVAVPRWQPIISISSIQAFTSSSKGIVFDVSSLGGCLYLTEDDVSVIFHAVYIVLHTFVRMAERRVGGNGIRSGRDSHIVMLSWYGKFPSTLDAIEYRKWQTNKKCSDEIKLFKSILSYCIS